MKFTAAVTSVFFLIGSYFANGAVPEWGYHHGVDPKHWKYLFPTCGGMQQSPIDIKTSKVQTDITLEHFDLSKLSTAKNVELGIQKDGQTVQVGLKGQGLEVSGGGLPGTYVVEQLNLHWGSKNTRGSEHEINEKHFSMEMQVVMHTDIFPSVNDAMNCTNGLAVLSFLVDIGPHNHKFDEIINHLYSIEHIGGHAQLNSFSLTSLFPSTDYFYRYYGSLTTPPCFESVIWTIFKEQIYISEFQLNQFRQLGRAHFIGTGDLINNYSGKKSRSRSNRKSKSRSSRKSKSRSSKKSKSRRGKKSKSTRGKKSKSASGKKSNYRSSKRSNYRSSKKSKSGSGIKSQSISGLPLLTRRAYSDFNKNLFFRRRYGDSDSSD
ncbi:carbonic anhydrase [Mytilus galloprovincialis]|uniref:carbonic anhydrase n=1 Tax=Mytilus galloprovincialis TaxID=29158 RepID=A0A8B6EXI5_MYTGA|nr:carbonic anhydrase [Mytilus galloprovincialis]